MVEVACPARSRVDDAHATARAETETSIVIIPQRLHEPMGPPGSKRATVSSERRQRIAAAGLWPSRTFAVEYPPSLQT